MTLVDQTTLYAGIIARTGARWVRRARARVGSRGRRMGGEMGIGGSAIHFRAQLARLKTL